MPVTWEMHIRDRYLFIMRAISVAVAVASQVTIDTEERRVWVQLRGQRERPQSSGLHSYSTTSRLRAPVRTTLWLRSSPNSVLFQPSAVERSTTLPFKHGTRSGQGCPRSAAHQHCGTTHTTNGRSSREGRRRAHASLTSFNFEWLSYKNVVLAGWARRTVLS